MGEYGKIHLENHTFMSKIAHRHQLLPGFLPNFLQLIAWLCGIQLLFSACNNVTSSGNATQHVDTMRRTTVRTLNVRSFHAKGDGKQDDTQAIQAAIRAAQAGDTVLIPSGTYLVKTLVLRSAVHIKGIGLLKQELQDTQRFTRTIQNSSAPLFFGRDIHHVDLQFKAVTINEALYISKSSHIRVHHSDVDGQGKKLHAFPGMLWYACRDIQIDHTTVTRYGISRQSASNYQAGTGIRLLSCKNIQINHNKIRDNGENGIFMHGTGIVQIRHNDIARNGMSAIQIGFGKTKVEHHFIIAHNTLESNAADAIDINNKITSTPPSIYCTITGNKSFNNGYVNGKSTVDGSGLATLVNVSGVNIINNRSERSNRPALYIEKCGKITAKGNYSDHKVEIVGSFQQITLQKNTFDALTILANTKGKKLHLIDNKFRTALLPTGITIDSLIMDHNILSETNLNINMSGNLVLRHNEIHASGPNGALLLVHLSSAEITENTIYSTGGFGITIRPTAQAIRLQKNKIQSVQACIYDEGSPNLLLINNEFISIPGSKFNRTVMSTHPDQLQMKGNIHHGGTGDNSIRFIGTGTAFIADEQIMSGYPDYGRVVIQHAASN